MSIFKILMYDKRKEKRYTLEEFSMDTKIATTHLLQMNQDEEFYRRYYQAQKNPKSLKTFLSEQDPEVLKKRRLFVKELMPENIPDALSDEDYFEDQLFDNIYIRKHNRYTPAFEHSHIFFEIIYVLCGQCTHTVAHRTMPMKSGDLCLLPPALRHSLSVMDDDSIILNILIRRDMVEDIFFNVLKDKTLIASFFLGSLYQKNYASCLLFHTGSDSELSKLLLEMYEEQMDHDEYANRILSCMLPIFFTKLIRRHQAHSEFSYAPVAEDEALFSYLAAHYNTITLTELAGHLNYTVPYCSYYIKKQTGMTFSQLLRQIRLKKAESLLTSTNISIHEISVRLGYHNPESFMKIFKKEYGMTPGQ